MRNKVVVVVVTLLLAGVGFFVAIKQYKNQETQRLGFMAEKNFKAFVPDYAPRMGAQDPKVYLVEFLDPECESCRHFHPVVKEIVEEFKQSVQLVIRYAPFHGNSEFAIRVLEGARKQDRYWETLALLFEKQPSWGDHHHPQPELIWTFLAEAGVDVEKIRSSMNDPETSKMIALEVESGKQIGVRQTPTFFVNGKPVEMAGLGDLRLAVKNEVERKD
ncbi:MAG TPA: thioredoxin domain-containing protein [Bacteriovoracaceae bacterium]|nr:thioredoxin domain-containing protein [Bacteriovoracaceae bacterium]